MTHFGRQGHIILVNSLLTPVLAKVRTTAADLILTVLTNYSDVHTGCDRTEPDTEIERRLNVNAESGNDASNCGRDVGGRISSFLAPTQPCQVCIAL